MMNTVETSTELAGMMGGTKPVVAFEPEMDHLTEGAADNEELAEEEVDLEPGLKVVS